jgi:predicted ATPase
VQDRQTPLDVFVGRTGELARIAEVMAAAQAGQPWLVVIEGDPGVGKTALVRRCVASASGWRVLAARASQFETDFEFGLIDQLLRAAGAGFPAFPQADQDGSAVTSFAVGARFLELEGELQAQGPVAILIEDLQWADRKSLEALTFMLRRLSVDPVVAMVTYRGTGDRLDQTAQRLLSSVEHRLPIWLGGLSQEEVASLAAVLAGPVVPCHPKAASSSRCSRC